MFFYLSDNWSFLSKKECLLCSNSNSTIHRVAEIHFSSALHNGVQSNHREKQNYRMRWGYLLNYEGDQISTASEIQDGCKALF